MVGSELDYSTATRTTLLHYKDNTAFSVRVEKKYYGGEFVDNGWNVLISSEEKKSITDLY